MSDQPTREQLRAALANYEDWRPMLHADDKEILAAGTRAYLALLEGPTDEQVKAAVRLFDNDLSWIVEACGENRDGPNLAVDALVRRVLEAALRIEEPEE